MPFGLILRWGTHYLRPQRRVGLRVSMINLLELCIARTYSGKCLGSAVEVREALFPDSEKTKQKKLNSNICVTSRLFWGKSYVLRLWGLFYGILVVFTEETKETVKERADFRAGCHGIHDYPCGFLQRLRHVFVGKNRKLFHLPLL